MGDFTKKISGRLILRGKKYATKFLGKTISCAEKNIPHQWRIMLKKNLTPLYVGEKIQRFGKKLLPQNHPYPPPPQTSNGHVNHLGGGGWNGFDNSVNVIHQLKWLARVHHVVVFKTKDWKYDDKRHKRTEKVQWNAQFPFCGQTKAFRYEIVFRRIQPRIFGLFWSNQGSEDSEETWGTFCTLWSRKVRF